MCFDGGVAKNLLFGCAVCVPHFFAKDHGLWVVLMVGQRDVFLHFPELVGGDYGDRVFLAVDVKPCWD